MSPIKSDKATRSSSKPKSRSKTQPYDDSKLNSPKIPEHEKLKGVIYPGMDVFDTASAEVRKNRNQPKSPTVAEQKRKQSLLFMPTEVVYSTAFERLKEMDIDGKINEDELLEGENSVRKVSTRVRRIALDTVSGNVTTAVRRTTRGTNRNVPGRRNGRTAVLGSPARNLRSSSTQDSAGISSLFSPTPKGFTTHNMAGDGTNRKRRPRFAVFRDFTNDQRNEPAAAPQYGSGTMMLNPLTRQPTTSAYPPLDFANIPTLHPGRSQNAHYAARVTNGGATSNAGANISLGQENLNWDAAAAYAAASYDGAHLASNPLGWHTPMLMQPRSGPFDTGVGDNIFNNFGRLGQPEDLVSLDRNPLNFSMDHFGRGDALELSQSSIFGQLPISPERTDTDHELEGFNIGRSLAHE